ncbi:hypothetical protein CKO23_07045 [Thiocystis violacea]|nr:BatD family protein [Thiocystis violacea]MBK1722007.1 hypothetical protein [Thiocystis violacea]
MLAFALSPAWAAELRVQVDRKQLGPDDVLGVQVVAEGDSKGDPDFTPLTKDFDILSQGQSQVTSIVNGKISQSRQWNLQLAPKRQGRLSIPALSVGRDRSEPVAVEVVARPQTSDTAGAKPLFLKAQVNTEQPYVQQVMDYRVKIYFSQEPQRAVLSEPQADGATIQQVGDDRGYDESVDGQLYRVIERRYQIIPQRSGELEIQSPRLEAMLPDTSRGARRDPFADLDEAFGGTLFQSFPQIPGVTHPGRRVVERAQNLQIQVRPQPAGSGSPWLPATSVQVADEWAPSPPVFRVGEPVTRTLTLTALGTTTAQLPNLDLGTLDGAQVYPDQPRAEDLSNSPEPAAVKTFKVALVPTRAGVLKLPEIRLSWWDTTADAARVVVVPERTVQVAPAPAGSQQPASVAPPEPMPTQAAAAPSASAAAPIPQPQPEPGATWWGLGFWPWLTLLLGGGWLMTLVWWLRDRRRRAAQPTPVRVEPEFGGRERESLKAAVRAIGRACSQGDPRAARSALLAWARLRWPQDPPHGLEGIAVRLDEGQMGALLRSIDRAIYAPPGVAWSGEAAWASLEPLLDASSKARSRPESEVIPDLYPQP